MVIFKCFVRLSSCLRYIHTCHHLFFPYSIVKNNTLKQEWSILSTTYLKKKKLTMLHIRLIFIGIKTGWAPKLSAPEANFWGAQLAPGEKMLSFVPGGSESH